MQFKRCIIIWAIAVLVINGIFCYPANAKEGNVLQCEFAGLLFNRLDIVEKDKMLTKDQKIDSLEELGFAPDEGYTIGEPLTMKQMVVVLIRIYGFEKELPSPYNHEQALDLLIKKKILDEEDRLKVYVLYIRAVSIVNTIEPIPGYKPGLVLLPRIPMATPASKVD